MKKTKPTVYMIREVENGDEYLSWWNDGVSSRPARDEDLQLEEIADFLDQDAESNNCHNFVQTHRALAALLYQEVGRDKATQILRCLLAYHGLHSVLASPVQFLQEFGVHINTGRSDSWSLPD